MALYVRFRVHHSSWQIPFVLENKSETGWGISTPQTDSCLAGPDWWADSTNGGFLLVPSGQHISMKMTESMFLLEKPQLCVCLCLSVWVCTGVVVVIPHDSEEAWMFAGCHEEMWERWTKKAGSLLPSKISRGPNH